MTTLSDMVAAYKICAKAEGKSPKTVRAVSQAVKYLIDFVGDIKIEELTSDHLRQFILALQEKRKYSNHPFTRISTKKLSPDTIASYVRSIKSFFGLLAREGLITGNPVAKTRTPKTPKRIMPVLSEMELEKLFRQPDKSTATGYRDYCVMLLLLDTGIRLSELCGLKIDDVDLTGGYLKVLGKGCKERLVPLGLKAIRALLKYKVKFCSESDGRDSFFVTRDGTALKPRQVEARIVKYRKMAMIKSVRVSPHTFRATSAVLYLRNGGDTFTLQRKLGHSTLEMTRRYSALADTDIKTAHLRYSPADKLKI